MSKVSEYLVVFTLQVRSVTPPLPGGSIRPPCREVEVVEVPPSKLIRYGTGKNYNRLPTCSRVF